MAAPFYKITNHFESYEVVEVDNKQALIWVFRDVFHRYVEFFPPEFLTFTRCLPNSRKK